jgi:hypothetical protein
MTANVPLAPRVRRILEIAYAVEGVVDARVWLSDAGVAVGLRGVGFGYAELLRRAERALLALREHG